jgi:hypothetical protein
LNAEGTSAVFTLTSGVTTAGVASMAAGVDGASYPATGPKLTLLESAENVEVLNESPLEKQDPLENDDVKQGSKDAGAKDAAGANDAPPSPTDPILSLITFKSPSFEWSGAPLLKQQLCQALAVLIWKFCLIEPGYRMGVLIVVRITGIRALKNGARGRDGHAR